MNAVLQPIQRIRSLDTLVAEWIEAKRTEDQANAKRLAIEADIVAAAGEPEEGSETHALADGLKLTVTAKVTRTVDETVWRSIMAGVPENLRPIVFVETTKLDIKGLRWLQENQPELYGYCAQAITAKRAKTAISVKVA